MALIIDGYNLLHVTGIFGRGPGAGTLHRSRQALLNVLVESLAPEEVPLTVVVFDAAEAPPGLPRTVNHRGITVHYASEHADADELIEELILAHHTPRRLTVVSSDHRVQRAARRRRAQAVDSDRWYSELMQLRADRGPGQSPETEPTKPEVMLTEAEVEYWVEKFEKRKKQ